MRRKWQPTPALLPEKSHGRRSLAGCSPWGRTELPTTEQFHLRLSTEVLLRPCTNPFLLYSACSSTHSPLCISDLLFCSHPRLCSSVLLTSFSTSAWHTLFCCEMIAFVVYFPKILICCIFSWITYLLQILAHDHFFSKATLIPVFKLYLLPQSLFTAVFFSVAHS